jgi:tetratricopeptide (TPR) repeat protein
MKSTSAVVAFIIFAVSFNSYSAPHCGELSQPGGFGPFDYTNSSDKQTHLPVVEAYHFTQSVESLVSGSSGKVGGDLDYTLRAFPNHHRALAAMAKLSLKEKTSKPAGATYSVQCYFDRAIRFKPNDAIVRMIYGNHLLKAGQVDQATEQLKEAHDLQPDNPTINYNLGLLYMQRKNYEEARNYAKKAYELGFPLPGLKNQLIQAGKWEE